MAGTIGGPVAYDGDHHIVVIAAAGRLWKLNGTALPIAIPASDPNQYITGVAYSASRHRFFFSNYNTIYASPLSGNVKTLATGFSQIEALTTDSLGNPYVVDNDHVSTVASGKPKPVTAAGSIQNPGGQAAAPAITAGPPGILYVADAVMGEIFTVTTTGTVSRLAGRCVIYYGGGPPSCWPGNVAGTGAGAVFGAPDGLAFDANNGLLYVADAVDGEIWTVTQAGKATPIAGYGAPTNFNGNGFSAFINAPSWSAFDPNNGVVYFAETGPSTNGRYVTASLTTTGTTPPPSLRAVLRFPTPSIPSQPGSIATAPDQSAWVVENFAGRILHVGPTGNIKQYPLPSGYRYPGSVIVDSFGNAWVSASHSMAGAILKVDGTTGTVTGYEVADSYEPSSSIGGIALGPDGNIWFTVSDADGGAVDYIVPSTGAITQFRLSTTLNSPRPGAIATGPDGNLWYSINNNSVGRITIAGASLSPIATGVSKMVLNPVDNQMWFIDGNNTVGSISAQGVVQTYDVACSAPLVDIAVADDGTLWLAYESQNLGHMTAPGIVTHYYLPQGPSDAVAARKDGTVWATSLFGETYLFRPSVYSAHGMPQPPCPAVTPTPLPTPTPTPTATPPPPPTPTPAPA